ncbi:carbohydrate esterase family 3 protein [Xylariaceae sp. AK1471]|nr:carbohydrate esterase family 3 protein [Xylariaceae sp. AK1471]
MPCRLPSYHPVTHHVQCRLIYIHIQQRLARCFSAAARESESAATKKPLRLMALGGSVTYGSGSSDGNGYRDRLRSMLISDGYAIEMVGSRRAGVMHNNHHEGWRGFRIDQIRSRAQKNCALLSSSDIFTINAGSNDCIQDFDIDSVGSRMSSLLGLIWRESPASTVILSSLLVNADTATEDRILRANTQYRDVAMQNVAENKRVVFVDMHSSTGPSCDDLVDGTHPDDQGYFKMAQIWHKGIREAASKGFF